MGGERGNIGFTIDGILVYNYSCSIMELNL